MTNETQIKAFWKSRTFWVNILSFIGGIVLMLSDYFSAGGVLSVSAVVNLILRYLTKEGVKIL
jgi:Mg2+/citrate symporter